MPARNTVEVVIKTTDESSSTLSNVSSKLQSLGSTVTNAGKNLTIAMAPAAIGLGAAVSGALDFERSMTNVGAVLGKNRGDMADLRAQILKMGGSAQAGPQAVADAYYDIVGGVADASTHMAILNAALATSEAGASDLGSTTSALISVMNSYGFSAEQAGYVSDVLTRTVATGVGSMDDFASAMPAVTGLANSMGLSFGDVGSMLAFLTTQGNTASGATTQLSAMMTSMLNPNESMKNALKELGFASGQAAVDQLGLVGAFNAVATTHVAASDGMAKVVGSVESLRGVTSLASEGFSAFTTSYTNGIAGATAATQAIQMEGPAAQFDLLKSSVSELSIRVGEALLPVLMEIVEKVKPVIEEVIKWITQNPVATATIMGIVGALVILGPILMLIGGAISGVGAIVGVLSGAMALLSGTAIPAVGVAFVTALAPILAVGAALAAVIVAAKTAIDFVNQVGQAAGEANNAYSAMQERQTASGRPTMSRAELEKNSFDAISGQFGGGLFGDLAARVGYSNVANAIDGGNNGVAMTQGAAGSGMSAFSNRFSDPRSRDFGGHGSAGTPYMIGTGAQPEMFIPDSSGTFAPNANAGGGTPINIGTLNIQANSHAEGYAGMNGALDAIKERQKERGGA